MSEEARQDRLQFVREQTGASLTSAGDTSLRGADLASNLESMIGSVEIPLAAAGPLLLHDEAHSRLVYAPLATTEGALVSSVTRGAYALSLSGGVRTRVLRHRMTRAPMFLLENMEQAARFSNFVTSKLSELRQVIRQYSNHAQLVSIEPRPLGKAAHFMFVYETGDAAGQNMTTTCTWHACLWLVAQAKATLGLDASHFLIEGGMNSDKKVSFVNALEGRGFQVQAEAVLSRTVAKRVLHIDTEQLNRFWQHAAIGAIASGVVGLNTNVANLVAAVFAATGQDLASVHESSLGLVTVELLPNGDLYLLMNLPSLVIGTVGGGTHLCDQRDCLELMGARGTGRSHSLAQAIAGFALALDLSTMSAICAGHFAIAHEKMGRNNQLRDFKLSELTPEFLSKHASENSLLKQHGIDALRPLSDVSLGDSILSETASQRLKKTVGLFPYTLSLPSAAKTELKVMVKVKPTFSELQGIAANLVALCSSELLPLFQDAQHWLGTSECDARELAVYAQADARFTDHAPALLASYAEPARGAYVLVQEMLVGLELMDSANCPQDWTPAHRDAAMSAAAKLHAIWWRKESELTAQPWLRHPNGQQGAAGKQPFLSALLTYLAQQVPDLFNDEVLATCRMCVDRLESTWAQLDAHPRTLVHHDFNPRNMGFERQADAGLVARVYDWELANLHVPQRDLVELAAYTLTGSGCEAEFDRMSEYFRKALAAQTGELVPEDQWNEATRLALTDFIASTLLMYGLLHTLRHYDYFERVLRTSVRLLAALTRRSA